MAGRIMVPKDMQMANKHTRRYSTWLIIRKMQIKTTMRYHLTLVRKKSTKHKCWKRCGDKGSPLYSWWECKLMQPLWRTVWRFLKKLELPYDPAIPLLGIHPDQTIIGRHTCTTVFMAAVLTVAKTGRPPECLLRRNG